MQEGRDCCCNMGGLNNHLHRAWFSVFLKTTTTSFRIDLRAMAVLEAPTPPRPRQRAEGSLNLSPGRLAPSSEVSVDMARVGSDDMMFTPVAGGLGTYQLTPGNGVAFERSPSALSSLHATPLKAHGTVVVNGNGNGLGYDDDESSESEDEEDDEMATVHGGFLFCQCSLL